MELKKRCYCLFDLLFYIPVNSHGHVGMSGRKLLTGVYSNNSNKQIIIFTTCVTRPLAFLDGYKDWSLPTNIEKLQTFCYLY